MQCNATNAMRKENIGSVNIDKNNFSTFMEAKMEIESAIQHQTTHTFHSQSTELVLKNENVQ